MSPKVSESHIAQIVNEVSSNMANPQYVSRRVDNLVSSQPNIAHYVMAHQDELKLDGVVTVLFHIALIYESIALATGCMPRWIEFSELDIAAQEAPSIEILAKTEPDIASYIASNLDGALPAGNIAVAGKLLSHVARALVR